MLASLAGRLIRLLPLSLEREFRRLGMRFRAHEPELLILRDMCDPEGIAIDVGAGHGLYALELMRTCKSVVCFEPNPALASELRRLFIDTNVVVEGVALGRNSSKGILRIPEFDGQQLTGWAGVDKDFQDQIWKGKGVSAVRSQPIEIRRLDDYELENVTFVKIDVEGFEDEVLRGAEGLISRCRPSLLVEIEQRHRQGPIMPVINWLTSRDYRAWFLSEGTLESIEKFDGERDQSDPEGDGYVNNFFFTPNP